MSTNYTGNPANVTTPLTATVVACSSGAGGLVLVQTSTSHMFSTNDLVTVAGVTGTTEANTTTTIQVISSTTFLLTGTTFVHAYSSGGSATDLSLTPYAQLPSNGEAATVDGILAAITCLFDRTQYLNKHSGSVTVATYSTAGSFSVVAPALATAAVVFAAGGGGGAGGGAGGDPTTGSGGGGAGGGSVAKMIVVPITGGATYSLTVGAGGSGGAGGGDASSGDNGIAGGDTIFGSYHFFGAGYGEAGQYASTGIPGGGASVRDLFVSNATITGEGYGGHGGVQGSTALDGRLAVGATTTAAGTHGATGATSSGKGGGGGGGGGLCAAPFTSGTYAGNGGAGGAGSGGTGGAGNAGTSGQYGCGGGGGGAGGGGAISGTGRKGGNGGDGFAKIVFLK